MKKICIVLALTLTLLSMTSCSKPNDNNPASENEEKYNSLVCDMYNDGIIERAEVDFWDGTSSTKDNIGNKNCRVLDNIYVGKYDYSRTNRLMSYTTDMYYDYEKHIMFGLNDATGELVSINLLNEEFYYAEVELPELLYEDILSLATKIASVYVEDISEYTRTVEEKRYETHLDGEACQHLHYLIKFTRYLNGFPTSDYISLRISSKGSLGTLSLGDINAFKNVNLDIDLKKISESISNKITSTYTNRNFTVNEYNIERQELAVTPDGKVCVYSGVMITGNTHLDEDTYTGIGIITMLE